PPSESMLLASLDLCAHDASVQCDLLCTYVDAAITPWYSLRPRPGRSPAGNWSSSSGIARRFQVLPHQLPFAEVLSIGDIVLITGLVILIVERMLARRKVTRENAINAAA